MAGKKKPVKFNKGFEDLGRLFKYNLTKFVFVLSAVMLVGIVILLFIEGFKVKTVTVEGSTHYTTDEITNYVMDSKLSHNTIFLGLKYKNKSIKDIPFVEQLDVTVVDRNSIKITVYEKYVAGCIAHLGNYLYFDNDGRIVEISKEKSLNVPIVTGLNVDNYVLYQELPVENKDVFESILTITKLLNKNNLTADIIYFDELFNVTLFFDDVRVSIGTFDNLDEKFMTLPLILPSLEGKKGILHMEKFSEKNPDIVFNEDVEEN